MQQSTIALIIMLVTIILFATEKLPLAVVAIFSALAMAIFGCISYSDALAGFSNTATLMVIGLCIIGEAFFTTGLADDISHMFLRMKNLTEGKFIVVAALVSTLLSCFLVGMIVLAIFLPVIDALASKTNGVITRKNTYLPVAIGAVFGGNLSSIGSSSMINASGQLAASYYGRPLNFFEPFPLAAASCGVFILVLILVTKKFQHKFFDFEEPPMHAEPEQIAVHTDERQESKKAPVWKKWFTLLTLVACVVSFIVGANFGAFSMLGAFILIAFGCIDIKHAMRNLSWETVFVVVGTLGFAKGVSDSGAGRVIAETLLKICGPMSGNAFFMCVLMLFLATLISNFMANNATVGILVPIALSIAQVLGASPVVFVLACGIGANLSVMTPICTSTITITASCGYRFRDYVKYGGLFNVLAFAATAVAMKLCYF